MRSPLVRGDRSSPIVRIELPQISPTATVRAAKRVELGTAVLPIQTRHPIAMAQEVLSNQAVCEGRFTLGLGASHHWVIEGMLGLAYERPAHLVRSYLEVLN